MSAYALTPETYAAWRHVESENKTDPREHDWEEIARTQEELNLLLADIDENPTADKLGNFFKLVLEFERSIHESLAHTMELYHSLNICVADLEARPEAFPGFGSEEANRRGYEELRQRGIVLAQMAAEIEEKQRHYSKSDAENRIAALDMLIARRRASEECEWSEPSADSE